MVTRRTFLKYGAATFSPISPASAAVGEILSTTAPLSAAAATIGAPGAIAAIATGNAIYEAYIANLNEHGVANLSETLLPVLQIARPFYDAAKQLHTGNAEKDQAIKEALHGLFEERKQIMIDEINHLFDACAQNPTLIEDARKAPNRMATLATHNPQARAATAATLLDRDGNVVPFLKMMDTITVEHFLKSYAVAAREWFPVPDIDETLQKKLAIVDKKAQEAERTLGLAEGSLQSVLGLDRSKLQQYLAIVNDKDTQRPVKSFDTVDSLKMDDFLKRLALRAELDIDFYRVW